MQCWKRVYGDYLVTLREEPIPDTPHPMAGWWKVFVFDPTGMPTLPSEQFTFPVSVAGGEMEAKLEIDRVMGERNLAPPQSGWERCR